MQRAKLKPRPRRSRNVQFPITIIDACQDPNLFQPWFRDAQGWQPWFAFLKAVFAIPLFRNDKVLFQECTQRKNAPPNPVRECHLVIGRRGGKSRVLALIATYLACFKDWTPYLSPGERGTVMILAADRRQARVIFNYVEAFLKNVPLLAGRIERETNEIFELKGQVTIEIHTASYRGTRGYTLIAALCDEIAFWRSDESHNPDVEIINAIRPGMATIPGSMLLCASSPYARRGILWDTYKNYFAVEEPEILVWQAPTLKMNTILDSRVVEEAYERDPARAAAEYGAQFRTDVEVVFTQEAIEAVTDTGVHERAFISDYDYQCFVDPSGGSKDSFTMAIAHEEDGKAVLDVLRERKPPFSPEEVVQDYCKLAKQYGCSSVTGDRYGGEWPRERFREYGFSYVPSPKVKSDLYKDLLPVVNSNSCLLLDNNVLSTQLVSLERRTAKGSQDRIDHPPGGKDDVANAVAGVMQLVQTVEPLDIW